MSTTYTGHRVVDQHGDSVGTVSDVFYDDARNEPTWLVIDPGLLRRERLIPVDGTYSSDDGTIIVPYDRTSIRHAPTVDHAHAPWRATGGHATHHAEHN